MRLNPLKTGRLHQTNVNMSQQRKPSQIKSVLILLVLAFASIAFAFTTPPVTEQEPVQTHTNSLYVEPCEVDYTTLNQVTCTAYLKINGNEYEAMIESVDYSMLTDVHVDYVLTQYPDDAVIEKQISRELNAYFDDRRTTWLKEIKNV